MSKVDIYQPPSALSSPRFCNLGKFMRLAQLDLKDKLDFAILGVPFDTGSSFRTGSRFGPNAIRNISAMIKPNNAIIGVNIMDILKGSDLGDIPIIPDHICESYDVIEKGITSVLESGTVPIVLGGDHSITLGELRSIYKKHGKVALVHFDSHLDLNESVFGQLYTHGTPFRRALEEGLIDPEHSIQIGIRGSLNDINDIDNARKMGFKVIEAYELHELTAKQLGEIIRERVGESKAFFTFDIDFVDPAYAPGTGTPEVGGFTSHQTLSFIRETKDINFVGFDVVEVSPSYDHSEITAYMAANIVFEFLSILAYQKKRTNKY